ncbi:MAG TPA: HU family DNA-binding protein [Ignavibacteriales bacterium]|nr:HU family DNA-binding protein [Ignavibacteriales bacterium]HEX3075200.1 HU family DNA-binding protein [Ignavibacteriales bacterium]
MNTAEVVKILSARTGKPQVEVRRLLKSVTNAFRHFLSQNVGLSIPKFGSFEAQKKEARNAYNPGLKKKVILPPKIALAFKPSQVLKDKINSEKAL